MKWIPEVPAEVKIPLEMLLVVLILILLKPIAEAYNEYERIRSRLTNQSETE